MEIFKSSNSTDIDDVDVYDFNLKHLQENEGIFYLAKSNSSESFVLRIPTVSKSGLVLYAGQTVTGTMEYESDSPPSLQLTMREEVQFYDTNGSNFIAKSDFLPNDAKTIHLGQKVGKQTSFPMKIPVMVPFGPIGVKSHRDRSIAEILVHYELEVTVKNKNLSTLGGLVDPKRLHVKIPIEVLPRPLEVIVPETPIVLSGSNNDFTVSFATDVFLYGQLVEFELENLDPVWLKKDIQIDLLTSILIHSKEYRSKGLGDFSDVEGRFENTEQSINVGTFEVVRGEKKKYQVYLPSNCYPYFKDATVQFKYSLDIYNQSSRATFGFYLSSPPHPKDIMVTLDSSKDKFTVTKTCDGRL